MLELGATDVRAGGGRGWGSGPGLPASHTTQARNTHEHMGPQRTDMHVYTHIHTGLAHACTSCALYVQSLSRMPYEVTSTHIRAHMEMEKGRSRQGVAELGRRQLSPGPQGGSWPRLPASWNTEDAPKTLQLGSPKDMAKRTVAPCRANAY